MIIALFAPELLLCLAINERINAGILLKRVLGFHPHLAKPGTLAQVYNWIRGRAESKDVSSPCQACVIQQLIVTEQKRYKLTQRRSQPHFGLVHAFYAIMGGFAFYGSFDDNSSNVEESLFQISTDPSQTVEVPKFDTLIYIMKHFPHIITDITEEYILDRAASSSLSKALLIVQVAWFCMNCASRLFEGLPLSLLEISTAAHALCTLLTYFVWWSKPINVAAPTIMREKKTQEVYALLKCSNEEYDKALEIAEKRAAGDSSAQTGPHRSSEKLVLAANALQPLLPNPERPPSSLRFNSRRHRLVPGAFENKLLDEFAELVTMSTSPILYGVVHFLAWNGHFPTPLESSLWRVSSFVVTFSGMVVLSGVFVFVRLEHNNIISERTLDMFTLITTIIILPIAYFLASGFLVAESIRQLFFLDPAAYQLPSWSPYWPRLS